MAATKVDPFEHVVDADHFHFFDTLRIGGVDLQHIHLPYTLKFMIMETLAAIFVAVVFIWVALILFHSVQ